MAAVSRSSTFHRFAIYYSEGPVLLRVLTAARHAGAEPAWHFARLGAGSGCKIELAIGGFTRLAAESFSGRMRSMPGVIKVMWSRSPCAALQAAE